MGKPLREQAAGRLLSYCPVRASLVARDDDAIVTEMKSNNGSEQRIGGAALARHRKDAVVREVDEAQVQ